MEKIADVLARKYPQFNRVVPDCPVSDALYQMSSENVDFLIVMENNAFIGLITDHDIASRILFEHRALNKIMVREFMSTSMPVATGDTSLEQAMQLMERYHVKHIAIFDRFDFCGVVSSHDLMQQALVEHKDFQFSEAVARQGYPWNY